MGCVEQIGFVENFNGLDKESGLCRVNCGLRIAASKIYFILFSLHFLLTYLIQMSNLTKNVIDRYKTDFRSQTYPAR